MTPDWASEKAAEMMALILNAEVTLDTVELRLAWEFRLIEAQATERAFRQARERKAA